MPLSEVRLLSKHAGLFARINFGKKIKQLITAVNEIHDDHATFTALVNELRTDHATFKALAEANKTLSNQIRAHLTGDYLDNAAELAIGSDAYSVATAAVEYHINGAEYSKAAVAAGTALSGDNVPQSTYGAWALDIGADGTIDVTPASANATGYATAELAAAGLPDVAADHVRLGYVTVIKVDDHFLNSAPSLAIGTTKTAVSHVEFTHYHSQTEYTEPALAAGIALSGDTIPQNKYGAFRLEIGADETLDLVPATNNGTGQNDAAAALSDLPAVQANHVAVGTITVMSTDGGGFVPGTTELDDAAVTAAYADGSLDGFFFPGTTELDDSEVTTVYNDGQVGNSIGAEITATAPAAVSAAAAVALSADKVEDLIGNASDGE